MAAKEAARTIEGSGTIFSGDRHSHSLLVPVTAILVSWRSKKHPEPSFLGDHYLLVTATPTTLPDTTTGDLEFHFSKSFKTSSYDTAKTLFCFHTFDVFSSNFSLFRLTSSKIYS